MRTHQLHDGTPSGGKSFGLCLDAKKMIQRPRFSAKLPAGHKLDLHLSVSGRELAPIRDRWLFDVQRPGGSGYRPKVFNCFVFRHASSIAAAIAASLIFSLHLL